jgi:hypothetical protein
MLTVRTPDRSTPRTHEATSAMSAVCMCTSRTAGSEMAGGRSTSGSAEDASETAPGASAAISHTCEGSAAARSMARRAPSAISSRATSGCRLAAPNLVNDSLTTTRSAPARNGSASAIVC